MFKLLLSLILALTATTALADDILLGAPAKGQTGLYTINNVSDGSLVSLSGVQLEIYEPGETFFGSTTNTPFVFGTVFVEGMWYTLQSDPASDDVVNHPTVKHVVMGVNTGTNGAQLVGHGVLTFDPTANGDAHTVLFSGSFDVKQFYNFLYGSSVDWKLTRATNVQIYACQKGLDFGPPNITLLCN